MDELQAVFIKNKLFIWGFSSHTDEVLTPIGRLENICKDLFCSKKTDKKTYEIEMFAAGDVLLVPSSMELFYNQFDVKEVFAKKFPVPGIEIDEKSIVYGFIHQEKKHGILFGDSYELFRMCLKFAFSLVSRQRFIPYHSHRQSYFLPNLDNIDDFEIFQRLVKKAPLSIKPRVSDKIEDVVRSSLEYFVNIIISISIANININLKNETDSDKWVLGLFGRNSSLKIAQDIEEGLEQWLIKRKVNLNLEYNMLFKLQEPAEEKDWELVFNLQSKKDRSLIIGLDEIWHDANKMPIQNIKLHLLKDLGTAAKVSKPVEKSLYNHKPHKIALSNDEAMEFVANDSFLLKDLGFVVQIPKITYAKLNNTKIRINFKDSGKFKIEGTGMLGRALFDFDYSVAIGDITLSAEDFYNLSRQKEKLVKVKDKWVEVNEKDIKKVIDYFEKKKKMSIADTLAINNSDWAGFEIDDVILPQRFKAEMEGLFNFEKIREIDAPKSLCGELRAYQKDGFSWMLFLRNLGFGGILADDMGLGKTIQTIAYLLASSEKPSLVICPASVLGNWQKELKRFSPGLKTYTHHGLKRAADDAFKKEIGRIDLVLSSYATARKDEWMLSEIEWDTIVLDEAQSIKNPYTKQAASIHKLKSKNRFCLSGTPVENRLSELWSIMNFTNPGFLSDWKTFKKNFAEPIEILNDAYKTNLLRKIISPFILRRLKTDKDIINDLPLKTEIKEYCALTKEQASLYQAIVDDSLAQIKKEDNNRRALIMATLIKLKQVCNHPSNYLKDSAKLFDRSGKVARLRDIVEVILQNNEKCLIFTQYKEMGDLLKKDIEDYFDTPACFLHGQQNRKVRDKLIDFFQSEDKSSPKIFILSLKAGGLGINLTRANHVIHFDRWWNPAVENQATDRSFRIGQRKDVFVYKFITTGTVEERIDEMIERKLNLSDSLLSKGESSITEMSNEQLKELFSLRKEHLEV